MNKNHAIHKWVEETRCNVDAKHNISALRILDSEMERVFQDFIPGVRAWHDRVFGNDGTLVSLLTRPISKNDNTEVFSAVVHGMPLDASDG